MFIMIYKNSGIFKVGQLEEKMDYRGSDLEEFNSKVSIILYNW